MAGDSQAANLSSFFCVLLFFCFFSFFFFFFRSSSELSGDRDLDLERFDFCLRFVFFAALRAFILAEILPWVLIFHN